MSGPGRRSVGGLEGRLRGLLEYADWLLVKYMLAPPLITEVLPKPTSPDFA